MKTIYRQEKNHFAKKEKVFGQFFTPKEVVNFVLNFLMLSQNKTDRAIDPACGDGAFIKGLIKKGCKEIVGVDLDEEVIASIPNEIKGKANILCKNGLLIDEFSNNFDIVVGNPPFSSKYGRIYDKNILSHFELGNNKNSQAVEILFLEQSINLASDNGAIGIILPSGIFANRNLDYVREYLLGKTQILGVISLPRFIFNGNLSTTSKTCILLMKKCKTKNKNQEIFMSILNNLSELDEVLELYSLKKEKSSLAFWARPEDNNLCPEFYDPNARNIEQELLNSTLKVEKLGNLVEEMFCGRTEYGEKRRFSPEGIPFISAKVVTNFGIDLERNKKFVSENSYMFKKNAFAKKDDLIFVRVGAGCAGRSAVVASERECGVVDDWCYIIRTKKELSPYFLSFYLYSKYAKVQINKIKRGVGTVTIPQSLLKRILVPLLGNYDEFKNLYLRMREKYSNGDIWGAKNVFNSAVEIIERAIKEKAKNEKIVLHSKIFEDIPCQNQKFDGKTTE